MLSSTMAEEEKTNRSKKACAEATVSTLYTSRGAGFVLELLQPDRLSAPAAHVA